MTPCSMQQLQDESEEKFRLEYNKKKDETQFALRKSVCILGGGVHTENDLRGGGARLGLDCQVARYDTS